MSCVYFIRAGDSVKVGASRDIETRLASFQALCPMALRLIAKLDFDEQGRKQAHSVERRLHERYMPWHLHHEWFAFNELMSADVAAINSGSFNLAALPVATKLTWHLPALVGAAR